jgi:hypothetical protein
MILLVAHNLAGAAPYTPGPSGEMSESLKLALRLVRFAKERNGVIWWDNHYRAMPREYANGIPDRIAAMQALHSAVRKFVPGYHLPLAPLEENGVAHDMQRALTHARNQNTFARMGGSDFLPAVAVANALQAYDQDLMWSQGRIHFTASQVFFQPPFYVDQMVTRARAPQVVACDVDNGGNALDVTARLAEDGKSLYLFTVNDGAAAVTAGIAITGFRPRAAAKVSELAAPPGAFNSPSTPQEVAPRHSVWTHRGKLPYRFPPHSFTVIQFEGERIR